MHMVVSPSRTCAGRMASCPGLVFGLALSQCVHAVPPSNDTCATAFNLNSVITPPYAPYHAVVDASMMNPDLVDTSDFGPITFTNGIWYTFTPTVPGFFYYSDPNQLTDSDFSSYSTSLFTLLPSCDGIAFSERAVDPYYFVLAHNYLPAAYPLDAGSTLALLVSTGSQADLELATTEPFYDLTFSFVPSTIPGNDTCATATTLVESEFPYSMRIDNSLAGDDGTTCFSLFNGVWFTYTPSWTGGFLYLRETGLQSATWATATTCGLDATCLDAETSNSLPLTAGQTVRIVVGGSAPPIGIATDLLRLNFDLVPDHCSGAMPIPVPGIVQGNLAPAHPTISTGLPEEWTCAYSVGYLSSGGVWFGNHDVWYRVEISTPGQYVFQVTALENPEVITSSPEQAVAIFSGCPQDNGLQVGCAVAAHLEQTVTLQHNLVEGSYMVRVAAYTDKLRFQLEVFPSPCPADFNGVNGITVQDIFDFLTAWLAGNGAADFNGTNGVTVQDIFDFLTSWLSGC